MKHIRATLALGNHRTETVAFPCADSKIKQMLAHRTDDDKYTVYVDELTEPAWMKPIEKTDVNIHEMNYLARRMDAMDDNELAKLGAALSRFGGPNLSQFINYTFNLNRITLVRDLSDLQKVGVMHYMDRYGGCSVEESNDPQRAVEARELLERKDGILTDYGLLFINDEVPFVTVYNGVNFPEYWYEGVDKTGVSLSYGERTEYLYCPCEPESVEFALARLGVDNIEKCKPEITCVPFGVKLGERVEAVLRNEGFTAFNTFCKRIEFLTTDEQDKLEAAVLYADATTSDELTRITDHLNDFVFAPGARDYEMLGRWWMEEQFGIDLPTEFEDFFNYSGCGEYLAQESEGKFVDGSITCEMSIQQDMQQSERQYEMAKRNIGITDSYVGERDATAQSGVAKQQQVLQSSGRLESKRVEKYAAYADIDQAMFELYLAYADEPRNVPYTDDEGDAQVDVFSRYSFLEFDAVHGEWYYNDDYTFAVEANGSLEQQRDMMWQMNANDLTSGAMGDPADPSTMLLYWRLQEKAHRPNAQIMVSHFRKLVNDLQNAQMMAEQEQNAGESRQNPTNIAVKTENNTGKNQEVKQNV